MAATDLGHNEYYWLHNGSPLREGYTNWARGEPSLKNRYGKSERCVEINSAKKWNDRRCTHNANYFMCTYKY